MLVCTLSQNPKVVDAKVFGWDMLRPIDTVIRYTFVTYTIWDIMDRALGPWWNDLEIHYFFQWCPWWLTRLPPFHRGAAVVTSGGGHRAGPFESALGDVEGRTPKGDSAIVPISRPLLYYETIGRKLWRTFLRQNEMVLFYWKATI